MIGGRIETSSRSRDPHEGQPVRLVEPRGGVGEDTRALLLLHGRGATADGILERPMQGGVGHLPLLDFEQAGHQREIVLRPMLQFGEQRQPLVRAIADFLHGTLRCPTERLSEYDDDQTASRVE